MGRFPSKPFRANERLTNRRGQKHSRLSDRRRALELLAASPNGCTEAIMLAHGFTREMMDEIIRTGLATTSVERMVAGGKSIEVVRVKITAAGRRALGING